MTRDLGREGGREEESEGKVGQRCDGRGRMENSRVSPLG